METMFCRNESDRGTTRKFPETSDRIQSFPLKLESNFRTTLEERDYLVETSTDSFSGSKNGEFFISSYESNLRMEIIANRKGISIP